MGKPFSNKSINKLETIWIFNLPNIHANNLKKFFKLKLNKKLNTLIKTNIKNNKYIILLIHILKKLIKRFFKIYSTFFLS